MEGNVTKEELSSRLSEFIIERETNGVSENNSMHWALNIFKNDVNSDNIEAEESALLHYVKDLRERYRPSSVKKIAVSIRSFFRWMNKRGYSDQVIIDKFPRGLINVPRKSIITFTEKDYKEIKEASRGTGFYSLSVIGWNTGMRLIDCATLKWSEIDLDQRLITKEPSKTEEHETSVVIPISNELYDVLKSLSTTQTDEYVNSFYAYRAMGGGLSKLYISFLKKNKLYQKGKTFHAFRRTAISKWLSHKNADLVTVRNLSGHKSILGLLPYVHASEEKKKLIMGIE